MDKFKQFILGIFPEIPIESLEQLRKISVLKEYKAKDDLYGVGKIPSKLYVLTSGITKSYTNIDSGNEYINRFHNKGEVMGPIAALIENKKAKFSVKCITDCKVIEFNYKEFINLANRNISIGNLHRKYLEFAYISYTQRIKEFLGLDATQRYKKLLKRIPEIDTLASQKSIASHLAITPIQLSRIKRKLNTKI